MMLRCLFVALLALALAACASTPPLETESVDTTLTPQRAAQNIDAAEGKRALWGGVILSGKNYSDYTELELLSYPVADDHRPELNGTPGGRFIARVDGYLELAEYDQGSALTVVGPITGTREGTVGETAYTYPIVTAEQRHLWPDPQPQTRQDSNVRFHFGLGVIFR